MEPKLRKLVSIATLKLFLHNGIVIVSTFGAMVPSLLFCSCTLFLIGAYSPQEDLRIRRPRPKNLDGRRTNIARGWSILHGAEPGFDLTEEEIQKFRIWPQGIIPYFIDNYSFDEVFGIRLRTILNNVNSVTNLRFLELSQPLDDNNERWVLFINRRGVLECEDYNINNFTNKGVQRVVLGYDCIDPGGGGLAPVVLALAGVPPQHNAPDRDDHITILMENIIPEKRSLFQILKNDEWLFHHIKYDFLSAGHYEFHKYTINGSATIIPKETVIYSVGEGDGISYNDVWKIRMLYNFISRKEPKTKTSDCQKLYKPGVNFENFSFKDEMQINEPRQKPAKYLGLSEDECDGDDLGDDVSNEGNENSEQDSDIEDESVENRTYNVITKKRNYGNDISLDSFSADDKTEEQSNSINGSEEYNKTLLYANANYKFIRGPPKRNPLKKMIQLKDDWRTSDDD